MKKVKENIWRNYLYLIKPFWDHGKMYMLLMILPAILINPLVSFVDVRFTERFIDSVLSQNWQAILFTVLTLQGVYYLGLSVSDIINLLYVPIQYQRLSRVINKAIFQKAQRRTAKAFSTPTSQRRLIPQASSCPVGRSKSSVSAACLQRSSDY